MNNLFAAAMVVVDSLPKPGGGRTHYMFCQDCSHELGRSKRIPHYSVRGKTGKINICPLLSLVS
jgi:hypothetical protein